MPLLGFTTSVDFAALGVPEKNEIGVVIVSALNCASRLIDCTVVDHTVAVNVPGQAVVLTDRLRRTGSATFRDLVADAPTRAYTVARFLALLELFRVGAVAFEQPAALGALTVRWTGPAQGEVPLGAVAEPSGGDRDG